MSDFITNFNRLNNTDFGKSDFERKFLDLKTNPHFLGGQAEIDARMESMNNLLSLAEMKQRRREYEHATRMKEIELSIDKYSLPEPFPRLKHKPLRPYPSLLSMEIETSCSLPAKKPFKMMDSPEYWKLVGDYYSEKEEEEEKKSEDCCYITSACLDDLGIPRTVLEMTAMKTLTKEHILKSFGGIKDYIKYGRRAPKIVEAIRARGDSRGIWEEVYFGLRHVVSSVVSGDYAKGYQRYKNLVVGLEKRFVKAEK